MGTRPLTRNRLGRVIAGGVAMLILGMLVVATVRLTSGRGLGLGRFVSLARAVIDNRSVSGDSHGSFTNIIFLHHSTGRNLIEQGKVRERFAAVSYSFWDHDYNWEGLRRPDGLRTGYSYNIPGDNTDPDGLARVFAQPAYGLPLNAWSSLLQHEVIIFKSCFPVSNIGSDEQLAQYKSYYLNMREVMDRHPNKIFVVMTPPPLNPAETNVPAAARARMFADWLKADEYRSGHANVLTFDFFGYLAEDDPTSEDHNMLRVAYREGADSHPNRTANEKIGPVFVQFVIEAVENYRAIFDLSADGKATKPR